jgi:phosphotransferase system HPr (HPr) family protein
MVEVRVTVRHKVGLHARPAALFVKTAQGFRSAINVANLDRPGSAVDAKSILGVLTLGVGPGHEILVTADGPDEREAAVQLAALVENDFDEEAGA